MDKTRPVYFTRFFICFGIDNITYRIYYPSNTITKTVTKRTTENPSYLLASDRGSNYLVFNTSNNLFDKYCEKLEDTSAPIEVVSFVKVKK